MTDEVKNLIWGSLQDKRRKKWDQQHKDGLRTPQGFRTSYDPDVIIIGDDEAPATTCSPDTGALQSHCPQNPRSRGRRARAQPI